MAIMARENPVFRAEVQAEIRTPAGRRIFDTMFGSPVAVVPNEGHRTGPDE